MVSVSDLTAKKSAQLVLGDSSTGIDVDEFVSKCISYMRSGGRARQDNEPQSATQRRRARNQDDDEDQDEQDNFLNWELLGAKACIPFNVRPAVPGFLLGPLSVQKRVRAPTQRRSRQQRENQGREARPEELTTEDMTTNERNSVRHECTRIKTLLSQHCERATHALEASVDESMSAASIALELRRHRLTDTGGPSLFDFVINPRSFGQTVENLFYVSFLVKEGEVGIGTDGDGLPTLNPNTESMQEAREKRQARNQAVFGLDFHTWRALVDAFEIVEPLIPHREAEAGATQVGSRGWYA